MNICSDDCGYEKLIFILLRGVCKEFFFSKNPRLLWKLSGLIWNFCVENHPKIPEPLIFWSILSVHTLLKVVSYYDLSVLFMSVMGFQKKVWMGVGGWGELYPICFGFLEFF